MHKSSSENFHVKPRPNQGFVDCDKFMLENQSNTALPTHQVGNHLSSVSDQLKKPLELIGKSMKSQQDFLRQLTTMQAASSDKSSR